MSLALATKGIISMSAISTSYPVYLSAEDPDIKIEEFGSLDIKIKELKPRLKTEVQES